MTATSIIAELTLADGSVVAVRTMTADDAADLAAFHRRLSSETIRRRFLGPHPTLSDGEIAHFTSVEHHEREALVATVDAEIVGVARFDRLPGSRDAEVAFVLADEWQNRGLGRALFELLATRARAEGIDRFLADTFATNTPMIRVLIHSGRPFTTSISAGDECVAVCLDQVAATSPPV